MASSFEEAAKLCSTRKYFQVLKDNQLITPSIGKPFPDTATEESMIMHRACLAVQDVQIRELNEKISTLLDNNNLSLADVLNSPLYIERWKRLKKEIGFLKRKFRSRRKSPPIKVQASKNQKYRERYKVRKFNKLLKTIGTDSVLNLSSVIISPTQLAVLSLGSGFIPTSMNPDKEEEILLLEGLRVIDRIGNLDTILKAESETGNSPANARTENQAVPINFVSENTTNQESANQEREFFENEQTFSRCKGIPSSLRIHQPQDRTLSQPA